MRTILTRLLLACLLVATVIPVLAQSPDRDGDGLADEADQCPDLFAAEGGLGGTGCPQGPDFDTDADGVIDSLDICPTLPAVDGGQDGTGCPPEVFADPLPAESTAEATAEITPEATAEVTEVMLPTATLVATTVPLPTTTPSPYGPYYKGVPPCTGSLEPGLAVGDEGRIAAQFSTLRTYPAGPVIRVIQAPATFTVIDGPVCAGYGPLTWYHIRYDDPALGEGWASESQVYSIYGRDRYWLLPVTPTPSPTATPAS